ncbi:MAG: O-antigen ligase family protein [Pseudomonadota bacterium]
MPISAAGCILLYLCCMILSFTIDASWGIYLYVINYYFNPQIRWWYYFIPSSFSSMAISVSIIIAYFLRYSKYPSKLGDLPQTKWLAGFLFLIVITSLYAVWPEKHYEYLGYQIKLIIILIIAYKVIDSPAKFEKFLIIFIVGAVYIGWVSYATDRNEFGRIEDIGMVDSPDSNDTAAALTTAIPLLIYYIISSKVWGKIFAFVGFAFVANGIILINSRGAFLAVASSGLYMVVMILKSKIVSRKIKVRVLAGMIVALGLFVYLTDDLFWSRMGTLQDVKERVVEGEDLGRMYFWLKTFDLLKDHPLGVGVSGYQYLSPTFLPKSLLSQSFGMRAVHSTYFQVLAEYGYFGFFLFAGLIISNFRVMRRIKRKSSDSNDPMLYCQAIAIESAFVAYLSAICFIDRLYSVVLYWSMLIIACFYNIYFIQPRNREREHLTVPESINPQDMGKSIDLCDGNVKP